MAQEPLKHHRERSNQQDHQEQEAYQEVGSSGGGNSGGGRREDWLRLGLGQSCPAPGHGVMQQPDRSPSLRALAAGIPAAALPAPQVVPPWLAVPPSSPLALQIGCGGGQADGTIRVLLPPASPAAAAGIWFALQAARNQGKEPFLPQIPRSYLRIRDGRVTVRLLIKYLVKKLRLQDESEVEITCRGRPLLPLQTLQHVSASIWCQAGRVAVSVPPGMSSGDHLMVLQYGRRT